MPDALARNRVRTLIAGCFAVVIAAALGAGTSLAASQSVAISGLSFSPSTVTVTLRETVTWTNSDPTIHNATSDDGSWNAGNIAANGGSGAVVFGTAGTFTYHCAIHPQMTGTVIVEAAAATARPTAAATMRPTDAAPIGGTDRGSGGGLLAWLMVAAVAAAVATAVFRRRPPDPVMAPVIAIAAVTGGRATTPIANDIAALPDKARTTDGSLAPIVIVGIASAVAIVVIWRRLTSTR